MTTYRGTVKFSVEAKNLPSARQKLERWLARAPKDIVLPEIHLAGEKPKPKPKTPKSNG